jgi:hypothetical protein
MDFCMELKIPIYNQPYHIILTNDIWEYHERNEIQGIKEEVEKYAGLFLKVDGNLQILFRDDYYSIGCITHEAFHLTNYIMKQIGSRLDDSSEEFFAYLLTYITEQVVEALLSLKIQKSIFEETIVDKP